jgi:ATP-dependent Clp protease, protease subunit
MNILAPQIFNGPVRRAWNAPESNRVWLTTEQYDDCAEIIISGQIGKDWWDNTGISSKEFRNALDQIPKGQKIKLRINSEGGSVQDGIEIYNAIKERATDVTSYISGYAVSIASVIPLAAARVISPVSSIWMIHDPWTFAQGNAEDMRAAAEMLDKHGDMLAQIYSQEIGKGKKTIRDAMKAETWFTGREAVEYGLADETEEDTEDTRASLRSFKTKGFEGRIPAAILNILSPLSSGQPETKKEEPRQAAVDQMKKAIVALLKAHNIEAAETETDGALQEKLEQLIKSGNSRAILDEFKTLLKDNKENVVIVDFDAKAEIAALKKARIQDRVLVYVDSTAITKEECDIFIEAALKDEENTFKILDNRKAATIGGRATGIDVEVLDHSTDGITGRPTEKLKNLFVHHKGDKAKIFSELRDNFHQFTADARRQDTVRNENTFSATITTNFLILGATTKLSPKFASAKMFARDASVDPYKPLASGVMKFNSSVQDGSDAQTNATNFENGDSEIDPVTVAVNQYTVSFHVTNSQFNSGFRMEDLLEAKLASLGSKISQVIGALLKTANFATLAPVISAPGAFGFGYMATAWGELKKANRKNMMMDGEYLAKVINNPAFLQAVPVVPGAGWKNVIGWDYIALHTEWSQAGANVRGFFGDEQAIGMIAGLPLIDAPAIPGGILAQGTGMLPGVDLPLAVYAWFNPSTRTYWASLDMMFGANVLDNSAGGLLASGNPG